MSKKEEKRKINFIKNYWFKVLEIDIYTYEQYKLNNMNTYTDELVDIIDLLENETRVTKGKNGLIHFLKEIQSYIDTNFYFKKTYPGNINTIESKISSIIRSPKENCVKQKLIDLKKTLLRFITEQEKNIDKMLRALSFLVYNKQCLEDIDIRLKSVVNDLIAQLLLERYHIDFLRKDVYKEYTFKIDTKESVKNSLKEQFQQKIEMLRLKIRVRDTIVIFRINNLKSQMPFELNGLLFYNPLRSDLLKWKYGSELLRSERGLLTLDEYDLIDKQKQNFSKLTESDWNEIKYTDAHCRIRLNNVNPNLAVQIARKHVEEIVNTVRYIYKIDHISVSEQYAIQYGARSKLDRLHLVGQKS